MNFSNVKAVLLDIDNTLLDFNECSRIAMKKAFESHGLAFREEVYPTFLTVNEGLWKAIERGEYTRAQLHKERWNIILQKTGYDYDGEKIERDFLANLYDCISIIDGANEIVEYLSSKYYLCTASNAPNDQQYNRLKLAGFYPYLKKVFTSEAIGISKPQKGFFDACFSQMEGITPDETVMIGDSLTADIRGAKEYGLKTIWYNHLKADLPKDEPYDAKVDTLLEIKKYL